ncbi:hypothetical protein SESBI_48774 [Sesbania bispinosa]|nr:hypothetical protein SESBI_48774 [Sesbania bispinosa]
MALLWTFSVLFSHYQLFKAFLSFLRNSYLIPGVPLATTPYRPVCVITGVSNIWPGISYCLQTSKEGYVVVIVGRSQQLLLETIRKIKDWNEDAHLKAFQVDGGTVSGRRFLSSKQYPYAQIYEYSKLCLLLFSFELHRQLRLMGKSHQIFVTAADPGVVQTNIMREVPASLSYLAFSVLKRLGLLQSPECGINAIIDAALAPPGTSGAYFFGGKGRTINPSALSRNANIALKLWGNYM